jgi:hypothetical protein
MRMCMQVQFAYAMSLDDLVLGSEFNAPFNISAGMKKAVDAAAAAAKRLVLGQGNPAAAAAATAGVTPHRLAACCTLAVTHHATVSQNG